MRIAMRFNFENLIKQLAEDYCNGRVVELRVAVRQQLNKLLKDKTTANALYEFFGIDKQNKNAKQILIKKTIKVAEAYCL